MRRIWVGAGAILVAAGVSSAQSTNTLRDPKAVVFRAYPEADSYRAIVRDVDQQARATVERRLPFKTHFNEIGPHALYVAFRKRKPVGLVYLRAEQGEWGLTEIAWSLTLDLRLIAFDFQSTRGRNQRHLEASLFAKGLVGQNFEALHKLFLERRQRGQKSEHPRRDSEILEETVLRSAMKTVLVTETVWSDELAKLQDVAMALDVFPAAKHFRRQVVDRQRENRRASHLQSARVMRAYVGSRLLGIAIRAHGMCEGRLTTLRWALTPELRVVSVVPAERWAAPELRKACLALDGRKLSECAGGASALRLFASELLEVVARASVGGAAR